MRILSQRHGGRFKKRQHSLATRCAYSVKASHSRSPMSLSVESGRSIHSASFSSPRRRAAVVKPVSRLTGSTKVTNGSTQL